jgi:phage terminase large subunit
VAGAHAGTVPAASEDELISLSWLEASRAPAHDTGEQVIAGINVAGPGARETVVTIRCRDWILCQWFSSSDDPRGDVIARLNPWRPRLQSVNVDSIGIGYNFSLHLRDQGFPVRRINVGNSAFDSERFANLKAEHYWKLRERFQAGQIKGISDERTLSQLAVLRYRHNSRGRVEIESKRCNDAG